MTPTPIRVCFSLDRGYIAPTLVAAFSLIETSQHDLEINILGVDFEDADWAAFERLKSIRDDITVGLIPYQVWRKDFPPSVRASLPTLLRLILPNYLKGRILYLDGDILVTQDLSVLFFRDMSGHPVSFCKSPKNLVYHDLASRNRPRRLPFLTKAARQKLEKLADLIEADNPEDYINAGIALFDLDKISGDETLRSEMIDIEKAAKVKFLDQTHLFKVFNGKIDFLDLKWNTYRGNDFWGRFLLSPAFRATLEASMRDAAIIHFVGSRKPWKPQGRLPFPGSRWFKIWQDKARALAALDR